MANGYTGMKISYYNLSNEFKLQEVKETAPPIVIYVFYVVFLPLYKLVCFFASSLWYHLRLDRACP